MSDINSIKRKCPDEVALSAYSDGMLDPRQLESIESHLASCDECIEVLSLLYEAKKLAQKGTLDVPPLEVVERAKSLVDDDSPSFLSRAIEWIRESFPQPVLVPVAMVLLIGIFSVFNLSRQAPQSPGFSPITNFSIVSMEMVKTTTRGEERETPREIGAIKQGQMLKSGDYFNIKLNLSNNAYVYLILFDSLGNINKLYPDENSHEYFSVLNQDTLLTSIPFQLDVNTGREEIYIVASKQKIINFDERIIELRQSNISNIHDVFPESKIEMLWFTHE